MKTFYKETVLRSSLILIIFYFYSFISFGQSIQLGSDINGKSAGDQSGSAVCLSADGKTLAIASQSPKANHVRVFRYENNNWLQIGSEISGTSVSLSSNGKFLAVGNPSYAENGKKYGKVAVYKYENNSWVTVGQNLLGENDKDYFGFAISMSMNGETMIIGAPGTDYMYGYANVYSFDGDKWTTKGTPLAGEQGKSSFGYSVAMSSDGNTIGIGAFGQVVNSVHAGRVKVYKFSSGNWLQEGQSIDGEGANDYSGMSISMDGTGNMIAIGSHGNPGNGDGNGTVRVFSNISGKWIQSGPNINGEDTMDFSGKQVCLSADGSTLAIGAQENDGNGESSGHVRIYKYNGSFWAQFIADIDGEAAGDQSGSALSLSADGNIVAIGAIYNAGNGSFSGHTRVFQLSPTGSIYPKGQVERILYPNPTYGKLHFINVSNEANISIFDLNGRKIYQKIISKFDSSIDLEFCKPGEYYLEFEDVNFRSYFRIIKL